MTDTPRPRVLLLRTRAADPGSVVGSMHGGAVDAVRRAGLSPVLLDAGETPPELCAELASRAALLVVLGGADVSPVLYGGGLGYEGAPEEHDLAADRAQLAAVEAALSAGTPLLGICRGMQLLAVSLGATLVQHLPGGPGEAHRRPGPLEGSLVPHGVSPARRMLSRAPLPDPSGPVLSSHHQAVYGPSLPHELPVLSRAADGVVEAVGHRSARALGVQWHPEHPDVPEQHMDSLVGSLLA